MGRAADHAYHRHVAHGPDDWRLQGQEEYLRNVELVRMPYETPRPAWDHDHCEFCSTKFVVAPAAETDADAVTEGYTTTTSHSHGAQYHWICPDCFGDFAESFGWRVAYAPPG